MVGMPQSWNWLENWGGKNDEMSRWVWEAVEDKVDKAIMAETEEERAEEREKEERTKREV